MLAICQCGHPGAMESLSVMFGAVGWQVSIPNGQLNSLLRSLGCDTVLDPEQMAHNWGGSLLGAPLPRAGEADMGRRDVVYIDVKAHRNGPKVWNHWSHLQDCTLWYRINGGEPVDVPDKGPELDPPCPVLTPTKWYRTFQGPPTNPVPESTRDKSYVRWPPFARWDRFDVGRRDKYTETPICLVHNLDGWGYGELGGILRDKVNLRCAGGYGSPDGLIPHEELPRILYHALAMVHLKSNDAPGYSLYEALAAGCPVILPRRFNARCLTQDLFEEDVTCLMFDAPLNAAMPVVEPYMERYLPVDLPECVREITAHLDRLKDPSENRRIGEAGRERLRSLLWSSDRKSDVTEFQQFLGRHFG